MAKKQKFIPLEKRSKKEQKKYHAAQRSGWGTVNPCSRVEVSPKQYNRKAQKRRDRKELASNLDASSFF